MTQTNDHPRLTRLAINEEGFVFDPQTGESFTVNASGSLIMKALAQGKSDEVTAQTLAEEYDINPQDAHSDFLDFVEQLRLYRLI